MQFYSPAALFEYRGKRYLKTGLDVARDEQGRPDCFRRGWEVTPIGEPLSLSEEEAQAGRPPPGPRGVRAALYSHCSELCSMLPHPANSTELAAKASTRFFFIGVLCFCLTLAVRRCATGPCEFQTQHTGAVACTCLVGHYHKSLFGPGSAKTFVTATCERQR